MTTFEFTTARRNIDSSLVKDAWYNAEKNEAVLNLQGWAYKYSGVGPADFSTLVDAPSVGSEYSDFKHDFGPAEPLGVVGRVAYVEKPSAKVGTPQNWSLASDAVVTDKTVETSNEVRGRYSLAPVEAVPSAKEYSYTLNFNVEGGAQNKVYNTSAIGVEQAIEQLTEVADMLDITIKVTSATVYFD